MIMTKHLLRLITVLVLLLRIQALNWLHCEKKIIIKAFPNDMSFEEKKSTLARQYFFVWLKNMTPRHDPIFEKIKESRKKNI